MEPTLLDPLYNLRCTEGHRHFSPRPEAWAGVWPCGTVIGVVTLKDGKEKPLRCSAPLERTRKGRRR